MVESVQRKKIETNRELIAFDEIENGGLKVNTKDISKEKLAKLIIKK